MMKLEGMMKLEDVSQGRDNNLDMIRFFAAMSVILSHSFAISEGREDILTRLTGGQLSLGAFAVYIFFFYGGFLICKSVFRLRTFREYFRARALRIFPPLVAVCAIMAFVAGPFLTELTAAEYFASMETYQYMQNGMLILRHDLPGIFLHNIYDRTINGSLWTLPVEFLCYCMCWALYKAGCLKQRIWGGITVLFIIGCIGIKILSSRMPLLASVIHPVGLFYIGMSAFLYRDRIRLDGKLFCAAVFGAVASLLLGVFSYTVFLFFPYILLYIGYATKRKFGGFARHGEISYGMYLCAWPVQQTLCQLWGGRMNPYVNFFFSIPIVIILGLLLCKLVEEPLARWAKR